MFDQLFTVLLIVQSAKPKIRLKTNEWKTKHSLSIDYYCSIDRSLLDLYG